MIIEELERADLTPPPFAAEPGCAVWRDDEGRPIAYAKRTGDWCWFRLERLATYRFPAEPVDGALRCVADPTPWAEWSEVVDQYYRTLSVFALEAYGYASMHASAVSGPAGVVVMTASSKTGKTTLALTLASRGFPLVADDAVILENAGGETVLRPIPFVPRARTDTAERFALPDRERLAPPGPVGLGEPLPVSAFVMLDRRPAGETASPELVRLTGHEAFTCLLRRAFLIEPKDLLKDPRAVRDYLRMSAGVPVYRLSYPSGYEALADVAVVLEELLSGAVVLPS